MWQRIELPKKARDFLLGAMLGPRQHLRQVLGGEVRTEHQEPSQMKLARGDRIQDCGEAAHEARGRDPAEGFVFRETQLVDAVHVKARAGAGAVDTAGFNLGEVREQARQELVRTTDEPSSGGEQLTIGQLSGQRNGTH